MQAFGALDCVLFPEGLTNARIHVHKVLFLTPLSKIITIKDAKCASQLWAYRRSDNVSVCAWSNTFYRIAKVHSGAVFKHMRPQPYIFSPLGAKLFSPKRFSPTNTIFQTTLTLSILQYSSTDGTRRKCTYRGFRVLPFGKQAANRYCLVGRSLSRR